MNKRWLALFCILVIQPVFAAEVYQWRDENGQLHFSDQKPHNVEAEKKQYKAVSGYNLVNEELSNVLLKGEELKKSESAEGVKGEGPEQGPEPGPEGAKDKEGKEAEKGPQ